MAERRRVLLLDDASRHVLHDRLVAYARAAGWILDGRMLYTGSIPYGLQVDGVLCGQCDRADVMGLIRGIDAPVVCFCASDQCSWPCVSPDEQAVGRRAAQHLLERGYRTLAFFGSVDDAWSAWRMQGFQAAVEAVDGRFFHLLPPDETSALENAEAIRKWLRPELSALREPLAIMVRDDLQAFVLIDALIASGYSVPEQIAVISAGNESVLCDVAPVPLSSVDLRPDEVAHRAVRLLGALMEGKAPPSAPIKIDPGAVKVRASTDLLAVSNLHAARALRFIWTRYHEQINVDSVSDYIPVTRRRLQTLFHEHVSRTMQEEIARVRMAHACYLLKNSSLRVQEIARLTGFKSSLHFHRTAQSTLQMGPKAFRESGVMPHFGVTPAAATDALPEVHDKSIG